MVKYHDGGDVDFTKGLMREQGLLKGLVCVCVCVCVCICLILSLENEERMLLENTCK